MDSSIAARRHRGGRSIAVHRNQRGARGLDGDQRSMEQSAHETCRRPLGAWVRLSRRTNASRRRRRLRPDAPRRIARRSRALRCTGARRVRHLETHISHVLLTGAFAYKIKKPVNLGFLDFTSLADRKRYCEQEVRLNRRLAPAIYVDVVAITGSVDRPVVGGDGPALEYAVRMREFPQDALASGMLARGALTVGHLDSLAAQVAAFHGRVDTAGAGGALRRAGHRAARRAAELRADPAPARPRRRPRGAGRAARLDRARARRAPLRAAASARTPASSANATATSISATLP